MSRIRQVDVVRVVRVVSREVLSCVNQGKPARVVVAARTYDTPRADLWDALTNLERIPRWFLPITGDLRLGGRYQLEGNAGGEIVACDPPELLALTWEMHGDISWVTVKLTDAEGSQTQLRLEHIAHVPKETWEQFGPGAVGVGWDLALLGLEQHIAKDHAAIYPKDAIAWLGTEEGKSFVDMSSEAWCAASIASGTESSLAEAAAARTAAFYMNTEASESEG